MNYRKKILNILPVTSIIIIGLILFITYNITPDVCYKIKICEIFASDNVGIPLFTFSISWLILSFILRFTSEQTFKSWLRFTKYYLPITAGIIILSPTIDGGITGFDKEFMSWFFSVTFLIVSLIIIFIKWLKTGN